MASGDGGSGAASATLAHPVGAVRQLAASVPIRTAASGAQIAIPILAVAVTGDIALGALLVALALVPGIVAAPLVGAVLDRSHRPRAWMLAAAAGTAAAYLVAAALDPVPVPLVAVALAASGLLTPFGFGGLSSFLAADSGSGEAARRAYALDALSYNVSGVAGPAVVAVLAPLVGPRWALVAMAAMALASLVAYPLLPMLARETEPKPLLRSMASGFVALATHRPLAVVTASGTLAELGRGFLPIAALGIAIGAVGDATAGATVVTAFAVGALAGAVLEPLRRRAMRPHVTMLVGFALTGLATLAASLGIGLWWTIALVALSGLCTAAPTAAMLLLRRLESPDDVVAQVFTVGSALRTAASAAGTAIAGAMAGVDPLVLLAISGAVWVLSGATMLAFPRRAPAAA